MRKLLVALMCVAATAASHAQTQSAEPEQGPTFRSGIDLISVDVAVVDGRGRPVEDLGAAEFSVKINGEVRRVVSAELVKVDVEAARKQVADKSETFYTSNLTPPNGRQIVLAVDQMNIRPGALRPIMAAAGRFLDQLSPLDQVAFITYPEPGPRVGFTRDLLRLRLAMEKLIGQPWSNPPMNHNIGVSEAMAISDRGDQIILNQVVTRECRGLDPQSREQCQRDVINESGQLARRIRDDAEQSLRGLRDLLQHLTTVDGPKSLILISEGLAIDNESELNAVVRLAAAARTSINVMVVDLLRGDITVAEQPPTENEDRRIQLQGLESLAMMSRGSLYHIAGTGEPIFDRLASEISAYYLLGVEQRPGDAQSERQRIDIEVRRRGVTIRSRQGFVLSPTLAGRRSPQDSLRDALSSPFSIAGVPLRVTTFAQQDPASENVRLTIAAHVGQPGAVTGEFNVGFILIDDQNRVAASFGDRRTLSPGGDGSTEPLAFLAGALVDPGIYSLRLAVVDAEGRRGSVVRDVSAWKMTGEELAIGDLFVGNLPPPGQSMRAAVEPHVTVDGLGAYMELYSTSAAIFEGAAVTFEIADDEDGPALAEFPAKMAPGAQPTWRVATGALGARMLPPGRYVARAQIDRNGTRIGVLARPFVLERGEAAAMPSQSALAAASLSFGATLPRFDRESVLQRDVVSAMMDLVERQSPALTDALTEARAGRYGAAALEALAAGDQAVAAFLRGIELYSKGQLDQAATQLQIAAGPRREFFPGALYLGAAFAAAGRDRDAAGVWQMALGSEPRPAPIYALVADARLRDGQPGSAIDILKPAYDRDPANDELGKRLATAYILTARYADAIPVLDGYLTRHPSDQDLLLAAILAQYELVQRGQVLSSVDRTKIRRYAAAYKGPEQALIDKYLQTMQAR